MGSFSYATTGEYKYLGCKVTPSTEINSGLKDLKDRAVKAFMKLKNKTRAIFQQVP